MCRQTVFIESPQPSGAHKNTAQLILTCMLIHTWARPGSSSRSLHKTSSMRQSQRAPCHCLLISSIYIRKITQRQEFVNTGMVTSKQTFSLKHWLGKAQEKQFHKTKQEYIQILGVISLWIKFCAFGDVSSARRSIQKKTELLKRYRCQIYHLGHTDNR